VNSFTN